MKLIKLELEQIISEVESEEIAKTEKKMLMMELPKIWNIHQSGNMEVEMETEFEKFMLAVSEHTTQNIDDITVFRFYALLGYIKEKNPKKN